ncbi:MAG: phosphoenolpyruvate carboxylase [Puniceicoccaceae bacterium]
MTTKHPLSHEDRIRIGFEKIDSDLSFLMGCFREVLLDLGEEEIAGRLPWIGGEGADGPGELTSGIIQATSISFQILNMIEENTANQMRRASERANGPLRESGLWGSCLRRLRAEGWTGRQVADALPYMRIEPVLTAHPTESKRVSILERHRELYVLLVQLENTMWTPNERKVIEEEIKTVLERLWRTGETLLSKPSVASERASQLHYFDNVFPEVLPQIDRDLEKVWKANGWDPDLIADSARRPRLRFGTWVGGDRDGHPLVTAEVTRESLAEYRRHALALQSRKLSELRARLSLSAILQTTPEALVRRIEAMTSLLGDEAEPILERNPREPWRQFVSLLIARLPPPDFDPAASEKDANRFYRYSFDLAADLRILRESLEAIGASRIARFDVDPVLRNVEVFGFHLAALDIRQNSGFHEKAIDQILERAGMLDHRFSSWPEPKRIGFLSEQLESPLPLLPAGESPGHEAGASVSAFREVARHIDRHGDEGIGSFILSMTRSASDLLAVYFLAREAGLLRKLDFGVVCLVPVVPLLETLDDLRNGCGILEKFLSHPVTANTLGWMHRRGGLLAKKGRTGDTGAIRDFDSLALPVQQVMIGYSDSNKDSGILASQWGLHEAQKEISALARGHGFRIRFFHGRGGTISRGAGPTHRFLEALPACALNFDLRTTEQGETIAQKFANHLTAGYNLDLLMAGTFFHSLSNRRQQSSNREGEDAVRHLSEEAGKAYRGLLAEDGFMDFYTTATPLDALEQSSIGSRPARRTGTRTLDDLRAIPWVFSWSQARFFLPGWYGLGTGLRQLSEEEINRLRTDANTWPFLRYVLTNIETSLSGSDPRIMEEYSRLVPDEDLRDRLFSKILREREDTRAALLRLFGSEQSERRPRLEKTLRPRNAALIPLHREQIRLLKIFRSDDPGGEEKERLVGRLLQTINAISSGLRTTG